MRVAGLAGVSRRKGIRTTRRSADTQPSPDLVSRQFTAPAPNRLWVADITYVPTWAGFVFLAVVVDAFSRRVVGWAMSSRLSTDLVLRAFWMAVMLRNPPRGLIFHSDRGSQYTSQAFVKALQSRQMVQSMSRKGLLQLR